MEKPTDRATNKASAKVLMEATKMTAIEARDAAQRRIEIRLKRALRADELITLKCRKDSAGVWNVSVSLRFTIHEIG